jgi:hypothetical protein
VNVRAAIAYAGRGIARPRYRANDTSGDRLHIVPIDMAMPSGSADPLAKTGPREHHHSNNC